MLPKLTAAIGVIIILVLCTSRIPSDVVMAGDPFTDNVVKLNIWTYAQWIHGDQDWLTKGVIFAPYRNSLLLSEPQVLLGCISSFLNRCNYTLVQQYNLLHLILFLTNCYSVACGCKWVLRPKTPDFRFCATSTLAVLWIACNPILFKEAGVLQLWCIAPVVMGVMSWWKFEPGWRSLLRTCAWTSIIGYTCLYYWLFYLIISPLFCAILVRRDVAHYRNAQRNAAPILNSITRSSALQFLMSLALGSATLLPFLLKMNDIHKTLGLHRSVREAASGSLTMSGLFDPVNCSWFRAGPELWQSFNTSGFVGIGCGLALIVGG